MTIEAGPIRCALERTRWTARAILLSVLSHRAVLPIWFVFIGLIGLARPPSTVAMGVLLFAITVVVIPTLIVTMQAQPRTIPAAFRP